MGTLEIAGLTDCGLVRSGNEDSIAVLPDLKLAVLADGMGGHQAGEVASSIAVDTITHHFREMLRCPERSMSALSSEAVLSELIQYANNAIYHAAQAQLDRKGMGSTVVMALFYDDRVCIGHVGDSRLYRLRRGQIVRLTQDHSLVQELVNHGVYTEEEACHSVGKNLVTRALGIDRNVIPDVNEQTCLDGDLYLLCSDGLNDVVKDSEIAQTLSESTNDLSAAATRLIALANERGGPDNISVILARFSEYQWSSTANMIPCA